MIKWKLQEQFLNQEKRYDEVKERYEKAIVTAKTHLRGLNARKEQILQEEFLGKDVTQEKQQIREQIEAAEKQVQEAEEERNKMYVFVHESSLKDRVSIRDLSVDWNMTYRTEVREAELTPIIKRMEKARSEYLNSLMDYNELINRYREAYKWMQTKEYEDRRPGDGISINNVATPRDLPQITEEDLYNVSDRWELPSDVLRVEGGEI